MYPSEGNLDQTTASEYPRFAPKSNICYGPGTYVFQAPVYLKESTYRLTSLSRQESGERRVEESRSFESGEYIQEETPSMPNTVSNQSRKPSVPSGFDHLLNPSPDLPLASRLRLYVRQQPIAARTCAAGEKSRRCIDPSPVLQLLVAGFDPHSTEDHKILKYSQYVVACQLFIVLKKTHGFDSAPQSMLVEQGKDDPNLIRPVYGKTCVSPFFVEMDPEPAKAPPHPGSASRGRQSTFFVFADLRIPTAGVYQLRFRLIDVGAPPTTGKIPILDEVWSNHFRAYPAKDFPGMNPAPFLSEQLKALGADGAKSKKTR
ncbi:hypothetical protein LOZ61_004476 [Ophidiomyces ophidiicola]|uniref:Uncharacterized protein n=1 Tax=Ophidiomyces ophidiicola TaxID=1387563 RepID=A0ACB8V5G1_9EURO|nr:hypothetical protein LOZ61_004476 [Ophidiomyces ophidiicola]KAI1925624.1 hypothetical protein LOZ60_004043 [Ophidiomyces ophidiicola]KAI2032131.1 hypothetical protein LOZ48_002489 [Ophidiomyces ophidiicola]KAI2131880.1 hypothetical protein LOZ31_000245 [Ophidiomyces ophidiicola]KAI2148043.1 hypothetical protein LOZ27_002071 [Ophidiomyces ophidiicola]